jgi:hypothetical protein
MAISTDILSKRSFSSPDETRRFGHGWTDVVEMGGMALGMAVFEPGWKWSNDVKPLVETESCQVRHVGYFVSGRLHTVLDDGTEMDFGPGDVALIPAGHDAWTVGDEPAVFLQVLNADVYAKR